MSGKELDRARSENDRERTSSGDDITLKTFIPLIIVIILHCTVLFGMIPVIADLTVEYVCKEMGAKDCNHKTVIARASKITSYLQLASTIPMYLASGTIGVLSDRLGRRFLMCITSIAPLPILFVWFLLSGRYISTVTTNWQVFVCLGGFLSAILGNGFVFFMAIFAYVADLTGLKPELRGRMYVIIESLLSISGVLGVLISGQLSQYWDWLILSYIMLTLLSFVISVAMRESTPPEVLARKVNWKQANSYAATVFAFPVKSTLDALSKDFIEVKRGLRRRRDICILSGTLPVPENYLVERENYSDVMKSPQFIGVASEDAGDEPMLDLGASAMPKEQVRGVSVHPLPNGKLITTQQVDPNGEMPPLLKTVLDQSPQNYVSPFEEIRELTHSELRAEKSGESNLLEVLSLPPPRNTSLLAMISILGTILVIVGLRTLSVLYYKQAFDLKGRNLTYVLAIEKLARGLGPAIVFTFVIKPRVKTRLGETKTTQILLLLNGIFIILFATYQELWFALTISCISGMIFVIPMGLLRHTLSSEVSGALQGRILSTVAAVEALTSVISGALFPLLFSATNDYPIISFGVMGLFYFLAAGVLYFRQDDSRTFNLRGLIYKKLPEEIEADKLVERWKSRDNKENEVPTSETGLLQNKHDYSDDENDTNDGRQNMQVGSSAAIQPVAFEAMVEPSFFAAENRGVQYEKACESGDEEDLFPQAQIVSGASLNSGQLQTSLLSRRQRHSDE